MRIDKRDESAVVRNAGNVKLLGRTLVPLDIGLAFPRGCTLYFTFYLLQTNGSPVRNMIPDGPQQKPFEARPVI